MQMNYVDFIWYNNNHIQINRIYNIIFVLIVLINTLLIYYCLLRYSVISIVNFQYFNHMYNVVDNRQSHFQLKGYYP